MVEEATVWIEEVNDIVGEINFKLGAGKLISFFNSVQMIKDPRYPLVHQIFLIPIKEGISGTIGRNYPLINPFFTLGEKKDNSAKILWGAYSPFGIPMDYSYTVEKGNPYGIGVLDLQGEFPKPKFNLEKKLCWGNPKNEA